MKNQFTDPDEYYVDMCRKILTLAPIIGACASLTMTLARILGQFDYVSFPALVGFDLICISYFAIAHYFKKRGIEQGGKVSQKAMNQVENALGFIILLQWNLISYIFPSRDFWGFAPMFVLLTAFMFHTRAVRNEILGISVSIVVSWLIIGEKLLPVHDKYFMENFILRVVALFISFGVIYILTYIAEKFTTQVRENFNAINAKNQELESIGRDVIDFTADIIEERDSTSGSHVKRMKKYTRILAETAAKLYPSYGLTENDIMQITQASVLHDVGKIAISDDILLKPGKLTPEEFEIIKTHTTIGARIIDKLPDSVGAEYKRYCREICLFHHEKYDGKGYPSGLKEEDIPISAQIVSVVDCYDALTNERPYKSALPGEVAINMILNGECGVFSDTMKDCLRACTEELLKN